MDSLEKLKLWSDREQTHMNRFIFILGKQVTNQRSYVDLFSKYPANSLEFKIEVERLYEELGGILIDCKENIEDLMKDLEEFQDVLETFHSEIDKMPND